MSVYQLSENDYNYELCSKCVVNVKKCEAGIHYLSNPFYTQASLEKAMIANEK